MSSAVDEVATDRQTGREAVTGGAPAGRAPAGGGLRLSGMLGRRQGVVAGIARGAAAAPPRPSATSNGVARRGLGAPPAPPAGKSESVRELWKRAGRSGKEPMEDFGWFGPGSVSWRVWSYPTSLTVGFSRSVVIEELDPFLIAPVKVTSKIYSQARVRYDRTLRYFATCLFADSKSVVQASEVLMKVHAAVSSPDPVSGLISDPNNPDQQLWIHITAWHSILYTYEMFGPGKLRPADEDRYWQECAIAAQAQTIDLDKLPRSREEVRDYFVRMRPRLAASEATQEAMKHLMHAEVMFPPVPLLLKPVFGISAWFIRHGVIASLPRWQRDLGNVNHWRPLDWFARFVLRLAFLLINAFPPLKVRLLGILSPLTVPVAGPMLLGVKPHKREVVTPAESYRRHGVATPKELYAQLGKDQSTVKYQPSAPLTREEAAVWAV